MTYSKGDLLLDEYLDKTDDDQLYVVEAIIDERRRGKKREFRIKWEVCHSYSQLFHMHDT